MKILMENIGLTNKEYYVMLCYGMLYYVMLGIMLGILGIILGIMLC